MKEIRPLHLIFPAVESTAALLEKIVGVTATPLTILVDKAGTLVLQGEQRKNLRAVGGFLQVNNLPAFRSVSEPPFATPKRGSSFPSFFYRHAVEPNNHRGR